MTDRRPRVPVNKPVDLAQLDAELGGVGLSGRLADDEVTTIEVVAPESVPLETLRAAIAAHVPKTLDPDAEFRSAVQSAATLADLKAALLGSRGPGAQARRR